MKRFITIALLTLVAVVSCKKFDDSKIWEELRDHENRIVLLEELCKKLNSDIINLQTVVTALETNDYIINASPLATGDGYTFLFKSGKSIVIYNGKDGSNGSNGKDGITPQIGVKQDIDGIYYWTINGEWLIVDGEKIRASAIDGSNGTNGTNGSNGIDGKDGITPQFKIEDGNWYISYNEGETWTMLGKATGDNGLVGEDGESFFKSVYIKDGYVAFILNDGNDTVIKIPFQKENVTVVTLDKEGSLYNELALEERRTTTSMTINGKFNIDDLKVVQIMNCLQVLDLTNAEFVGGDLVVNPYQASMCNRSLMELRLPKTLNARVNISYCIALTKLVISSDNTYLMDENYLCDNLKTIEYSEGVTTMDQFEHTEGNIKTIVYPSTMVNIPPTISHYSTYSKSVSSGTTSGSGTRYTDETYVYDLFCSEYICYATTPPVVTSSKIRYIYDSVDKYYYYVEGSSNTQYHYYRYKLNIPNGAILYVPEESIELYRNAPLWEKFNNIQAIRE